MPELVVAGLLPQIGAQAQQADHSGSVDADVIRAIKQNNIMRYTAAESIGGLNCSIVHTGLELEAVAGCCTSTAWVLWNHLCTFHLFAGLLGPAHVGFLRDLVKGHKWVCFPAGASTAIRGELDPEDKQTLVLTGKGAFGSGARYADFAGVSFIHEDTQKPNFGLLNLHQRGVHIDADWQAMSLRASATDTVHYQQAELPLAQMVEFPFMYRVAFRDPDRAMIHARYREDWVGLSGVWLGLMAAGVTQANLQEVVSGIKDRIAIMGVKVAQRTNVHLNLGQAYANVRAARDTVLAACAETDQRIASGVIASEEDYLRQLAAAVSALQLCDQAMQLMLRVMGGNGLRQGTGFERRLRDFQAMPLHINSHQERVNEQMGRYLLGLEAENPF